MDEYLGLTYALNGIYRADQWQETAGFFPLVTCLGFATAEVLVAIGHDKSLTVVADTFRGTAACAVDFCLGLGRPFACTLSAINMVRALQARVFHSRLIFIPSGLSRGSRSFPLSLCCCFAGKPTPPSILLVSGDRPVWRAGRLLAHHGQRPFPHAVPAGSL